MLDKFKSKTQQTLFVSNQLLRDSQSGIFTVTSSNKIKTLIVKNLVTEICKSLASSGKKVLVLCHESFLNDKKELSEESSFTVEKINFDNFSRDVFLSDVAKSKEKYDYIFLLLPQLLSDAVSLEIALSIKSTILIERYGYAKYKNFEETLEIDKKNNLGIYGVIAIK